MTKPRTVRHEDGMTSIICYGPRPKSERPLFSVIASSAATSFAVSIMLLLSTGQLNQKNEVITSKLPVDAINMEPNYENMSKESISNALIEKNEPFKAIAVLLEDVRTDVYYDSGGRNIGAGYLLSKQIASKGRAGVIAELTSAGVPVKSALALTDSRSPDRDRVTITKGQAIRLLSINQLEYERAASKWLGKEVYADLSPSQQAAVAYLAYNVGATKLSKFAALRKAIQQSDEGLINKHLKVNYRNGDGDIIENKRVGSVLKTAFLSEEDAPFIPAKALGQKIAMNN